MIMTNLKNGESMDQPVKREALIIGLGYDGFWLSGLGGLICLFFFQGNLGFSPDQWTDILVYLLAIFPGVMAVNVGLAYLTIHPVYSLLGDLEKGIPCSKERIRKARRRLFIFPTYSSLISGTLWALGSLGLAVWLIYFCRCLLAEDLLIFVIAGVFLGPLSSVLFFFLCRRRLEPVHTLISQNLPAEDEVIHSGLSLKARMNVCVIYLLLAVISSMVVVRFKARETQLVEQGLQEAKQWLELVDETDMLPAIETVGYRLRPFILDRSGSLVKGDVSAQELKYLKSSPRALGREQWSSMHPTRSSLSRLLSNLVYEPDFFRAMIGDKSLVVLFTLGQTGEYLEGALIEIPPYKLPGLDEGWQKFLGHRWTMFILFTLSILILTVLLSAFLSDDVTRPIIGLRQATQSFHNGRYDAKYEVATDDEVGRLIQDFNRMTEKWSHRVSEASKLVGSLEDMVRQLSTSSMQIVSVATQQSAGATQQAASIQQVSSTSEQIAATLKGIAESAKSVEDVSGQTLHACQTGQNEIQSVSESMIDVSRHVEGIAHKMLEFEENSRQIESVLDLIREVSEKTNMISLNASIESAAVGEAGARFAIIAGEIRELAERTVDATRDTLKMIEYLQKSTSRVILATEEGTKKVHSSQSKMERVSESFQQVIHLAGETARSAQEIAISSSQQTSASEHLAATIAEINEVGKNFVESANQIERYTSELNSMSDQLSVIISGHESEQPRA